MRLMDKQFLMRLSMKVNLNRFLSVICQPISALPAEQGAAGK